MEKEACNRELIEQMEEVIKSVLKPTEQDGGRFLKWLPPYILFVSLSGPIPMLYVSFYRCFSESILTSMYLTKLRKLNASGLNGPYSVILSNPEAIFKYGTQVYLQAPISPLRLQYIISQGLKKADEGYNKIIEV